MEQTLPRCVNHPDTETRLSCSSCDAPICTRCMRQGAVGQKCPSCARSPRRARALGKPRHYARGGAAGAGVALAGGLLANLVLGVLAFGAIIVPSLLGFATGRAVRWGAEGQSSTPFAWMAGSLAAVGALVAHGLFLRGPFAVIGVAAAAYFALRGLGR